MKLPTKIVYKVEDGMDPTEILCTTYQMRDMYTQFGSAFFNSGDIMNYILHDAALKYIKKGDKVLDVCCGRALMLPLIRFNKPTITCYVGVDIHPGNYREAFRHAGITPIKGKFATNYSGLTHGEGDPFYPFPIFFVNTNVAIMSMELSKQGLSPFDTIIYTASLEHMQKEAGIRSLQECYDLLRNKNSTLFLSTPNTEGDPYDTQYAAHLYEWSLEEVIETVDAIGFKVEKVFGVLTKVRGYREKMEEYYPDIVPIYDRLLEYMPSRWVHAVVPILTPTIADEVALVLRKD